MDPTSWDEYPEFQEATDPFIPYQQQHPLDCSCQGCVIVNQQTLNMGRGHQQMYEAAQNNYVPVTEAGRPTRLAWSSQIGYNPAGLSEDSVFHCVIPISAADEPTPFPRESYNRQKVIDLFATNREERARLLVGPSLAIYEGDSYVASIPLPAMLAVSHLTQQLVIYTPDLCGIKLQDGIKSGPIKFALNWIKEVLSQNENKNVAKSNDFQRNILVLNAFRWLGIDRRYTRALHGSCWAWANKINDTTPLEEIAFVEWIALDTWDPIFRRMVQTIASLKSAGNLPEKIQQLMDIGHKRLAQGVDSQKDHAVPDFQKQIWALSRQLRWAEKAGNLPEQERLRQEIREVRREWGKQPARKTKWKNNVSRGAMQNLSQDERNERFHETLRRTAEGTEGAISEWQINAIMGRGTGEGQDVNGSNDSSDKGQ